MNPKGVLKSDAVMASSILFFSFASRLTRSALVYKAVGIALTFFFVFENVRPYIALLFEVVFWLPAPLRDVDFVSFGVRNFEEVGGVSFSSSDMF